MARGWKVSINDLTKACRSKWSESECTARCRLATAYHLVSRLKWDELIYGHLTLRVPGTDHFLINPFGMPYSLITARSLVKVDLDGIVIDPGCTKFSFQRTGYVIHSAIHGARKDLNALIHIHTSEGMAVASSVERLQPVCQHSVFIEPVSYHPYRGIVVDQTERAELARNFPVPSKCLVMRNHGLLTGGGTIEEAFLLMFYLHAVCKVYVDAGYTHRPVPENFVVSPDIVENSVRDTLANNFADGSFGLKDFQAMALELDREGMCTGYPYSEEVSKLLGWHDVDNDETCDS
eukprot:sb/3467595/